MKKKLGRPRGHKNGSAAVDVTMRKQGWLRREEAAERLQVRVRTVSQWVLQDKVRNHRASYVNYVSWPDCVKAYGVQAAVMIGALSQKDAEAIGG